MTNKQIKEIEELRKRIYKLEKALIETLERLSYEDLRSANFFFEILEQLKYDSDYKNYHRSW